MFGIGGAEMLVVMLLSGGTVGLPVGIPPGETDPVLANIAPAECLYYTSWASMGTPDPASKNECERLLREPEVKRFIDQLDQLLVGLVSKNAEPEQAEAARQAAFLGKLAVTRPAAIFITKFKPAPGKTFTGQAAIVVNVGDKTDEVVASLKKIVPSLPVEAKPVTIAGASFQRCDAPGEGEGTVTVTWGVKGKYLIVGVGDGAVEGVLQRAAGTPPAWLTQIQKDLVVPRQGVIAYADVAAAIELATAGAGAEAPKVKKYLKVAGFENVTYYASATGLTETGCVTRSILGVEGKLQGFLQLAEAKPLAAADVAHVPGSTSVALAVRVDPKTVLELAMAAAAAADDGETPADFRNVIPMLEKQFGINLADIVDSLGDTWTVYDEPGGGGLMSGWTLSVTIRDKAKAQKIQERIVALVQAQADKPEKKPEDAELLPGHIPSRGPPVLRRVQLAGHEVFQLQSRDAEMPFSPAWCIAGDRLVLAQVPQSIQAFLTRPPSEAGLAARPEVAALLDAKPSPVAFGYVDAKPLFRLLYPFLLIGAHSAATESKVGMDLSLIPSGDALARHMSPMVQAVRRVPQGIEIEQRQSFPGSGFSAATPLLPVLMIPAVMSAREAAHRNQGTNNLKNLVLAVLNFESAYGGYPAAYSTDKDGKPLLSWRVHMLPYLEEDVLYKEFHLDEPWDSEHNKKLIERMPPMFNDPLRKAPPGETHYLAVRGERTIIMPPAKDQIGKPSPTGTRIADVTDGTSNTVLIVEAKSSVPWTKPEDFEPDAKDAGQGLLDDKSTGFGAALADGSVRWIASSIDRAVLKLLFDRADGEAVNAGEF